MLADTIIGLAQAMVAPTVQLQMPPPQTASLLWALTWQA